jgi:hypothetical protein
MSIFKIKVKPIIKEREYKVSHVKSGRKAKRCVICERYHACSTDAKRDCAKILAERLKTDLNET